MKLLKILKLSFAMFIVFPVSGCSDAEQTNVNPDGYTVVFNANGGIFSNSEEIKSYHKMYGEHVEKEMAPYRNGFTFTNWTAVANGNKIDYDFSTDYVIDNLFFYANWEKVSLDFYIHSNYGTNYTNNDEYPINHVGIDQYELKFHYYNDSIDFSNVIECGNGVDFTVYTDSNLESITDSHLTPLFDGKNEFYIKIFGYNYRGIKEEYLISLDVYKSKQVDVTYAYYDYNGSKIIINQTTAETIFPYTLYYYSTEFDSRYQFSGYYLEGDKTKTPINHYTLTKDTTFICFGDAQEYNVQFITNDGLLIKNEKIKYGATLILPKAPEFIGLEFIGYKTASSSSLIKGESFVYSINRSATFIARYQTLVSQLHYDLGGGSCNETLPTSVTYGNDYLLPTPVLEGKTFLHYEINGEIVPIKGKWNISLSSVTLVAIYTSQKYKLTISCNEEAIKFVGKTEYEYGETALLAYELLNNEYKFRYWLIEGVAYLEKTVEITITKDISISLCCEQKEHKVNIVAENGSYEAFQSNGWYYGSVWKIKATPNAGYYFVGWFDSKSNLLTSNSLYEFTIVENSYNLIALFDLEKYEINIISETPDLLDNQTIENCYYNQEYEIELTMKSVDTCKIYWCDENRNYIDFGKKIKYIMPSHNATLYVTCVLSSHYFSKPGVINLGEYPQKLVENKDVINELNECYSFDKTVWNQYSDLYFEYEYIVYDGGYYDVTPTVLENDPSYYFDVTLDSKKYRGVYFEQHRRSECYNTNFETNTLYWFEFEPVQWSIGEIDELGTVLFSYNLLDYKSPILSADQKTYIKYENSDVKTWLENDFYNTLFASKTDEEKLLTFTNKDKNATSKISLPSHDEYNDIINSRFGLTKMYITDYARFRDDSSDFDVSTLYLTTEQRLASNYSGILPVIKINEEVIW